MSQAVPLYPSGPLGWDGQLGPRPVGGMGRIGQGCPGQSLCIPVGHRDGMASWDQGPWVG